MSDFPTPEESPGGAEPWTDTPVEPNAHYGRPPTSKAAVAALVCALPACIPVLSPLLGLILGIVGIRNTRAGRRGGRGLATAAVIIAIVGAGLQGVAGAWAYYAYRTLVAAKELAEVTLEPLKNSVVRVEELAPKAYAMGSARFRQRVSQEQFNEWFKAVLANHGQLRTFARGQWPPLSPHGDDTVVLHMVGSFLQGPAAIDLRIAVGGDRAELDDIRVEGVSPIPEGAGPR